MRQPRRLVLPALAVAGMFVVSACGDVGYTATYVENRPSQGAYGQHDSGHGGSTGEAAAPIGQGSVVNVSGAQVGTVELGQAADGVHVTIEVSGLQPGYHGLHVHAIGKCEGTSADPTDAAKTGAFLSSGPHLAGQGAAHPEHAGDLPVLLVGADGKGTLDATSERLTPELLFDADGSSIIIHGVADNYANIPTRYASTGPDDETKKAGDSGPRVACAVLTKTESGSSAEATAGSGH